MLFGLDGGFDNTYTLAESAPAPGPKPNSQAQFCRRFGFYCFAYVTVYSGSLLWCGFSFFVVKSVEMETKKILEREIFACSKPSWIATSFAISSRNHGCANETGLPQLLHDICPRGIGDWPVIKVASRMGWSKRFAQWMRRSFWRQIPYISIWSLLWLSNEIPSLFR